MSRGVAVVASPMHVCPSVYLLPFNC